jgi:hypothetical protein
LKLEYNPKIFWVENKIATGKDIAEHVNGPTKIMPRAVLWLDVRNSQS